jgi:catechol 2,3-dioxygenase-like lactoylglutathione lyase family enzyme
MSIGVLRIRQVKIPVTDLAFSAKWYRDLLDLEVAMEFEEDGEVRGVVLADRTAGFVIGLREREHCESKPVLAGFDVVGFELADRDSVNSLFRRCDECGIAHGDVHERGDYGVALDVPDPDGTVLRFIAGKHIGEGFDGLAFGAGPPTFYDDPRLPL